MKYSNKNIVFIGTLFFALVSPLVYAEKLPPLPQGPLLLTSVQPNQLNPEYWIDRIQDAEVPIKTPHELKEFNNYIHTLIKQRVDVFKMSKLRRGKEIRDDLEHVYKALKSRRLYDADSKDVPGSFFENDIKPIVAWDKVPAQVKVRWGAAIRSTSVRALPTDVKTLEKPYDIEFDQFQFTLIKTWTPVAILHTSSDGLWYYIQATYTRGWVKANDISTFSNPEILKRYVESKRFIVVTGESITVFKSSDFTKSRLRASMGTVFPLKSNQSNYYEVFVPARSKKDAAVTHAYVTKKSDVSVGYLPYSQANMIRQAFKLLGARYGWGGMYNGRDCSGFTHDVFLSLGVDMPRNSQEQAFVGTKLGFFKPFETPEEKEDVLRQARPGITLMAMAHHLMLYLGEVDGKFYTIHSTWAERISQTSDEKNRINQVVVSDLSLNGNSYLGPLFERIISINEVD